MERERPQRAKTGALRRPVVIGLWMGAVLIVAGVRWVLNDPAPTSQRARKAAAQRASSAPVEIPEEASLRRQCDLKLGAACDALAQRAGHSEGGSQELYRRGCAYGYAPSCEQLEELAVREECEQHEQVACAALAQIYLGEPGRRELGVRLDAQMCDHGFAFSCERLPPDVLEERCDRSDLRSCYLFSQYLRKQEGPGEGERAFVLARETCAAGYAPSCARFSETDLEGACERGESGACGALGQVILQRKQTRERGRFLYMRACEEGHMPSCVYAAGRLMGSGPGEAAGQRFALYQRACAAGQGPGCDALGLAYELGQGVEWSPPQAVEPYEQACELGFARSCARLGSLYVGHLGLVEDLGRSVRFHLRACDFGMLSSCVRAARVLAAGGQGVERDEARAVELYRQACELLHAEGCGRLADVYRLGQGVMQNERQAVALYERSCHGGERAGVSWVGAVV